MYNCLVHQRGAFSPEQAVSPPIQMICDIFDYLIHHSLHTVPKCPYCNMTSNVITILNHLRNNKCPALAVGCKECGGLYLAQVGAKKHRRSEHRQMIQLPTFAQINTWHEPRQLMELGNYCLICREM